MKLEGSTTWWIALPVTLFQYRISNPTPVRFGVNWRVSVKIRQIR